MVQSLSCAGKIHKARCKREEQTKMILTYKYRFYPTQKQMIYINNTFAIIQKYWNKLLLEKNDYFKKYSKILNHTIQNIKINDEYIGNGNYDKLAVKSSLFQLNTLYKISIKARQTLKLKNNYSQKSYPINNYNNRILLEKDSIFIGGMGVISIANSRSIPNYAKINKAIILKTNTNKYFICISFFIEEKAKEVVNYKSAIGLDFSIHNLYVDSNGNRNTKYMSHEFDCYYDKLRKLYAVLKKKKKGSSNYIKIYQKISSVYEKIKNIKKDFLHKESSKIVSKYDIIVVESLDLKDMASSYYVNKETGNKFKLGGKVYEKSYALFISYLNYKCKLNGKKLIFVDRHFPSSQICNNCGFLNKEAKQLNKKTIICPQCGRIYDRDINAAKNIRDEGLRILNTKKN